MSSITSANPDDLDHFVQRSARTRRSLEGRLRELAALSSAVIAASPDYAVQSNVLAGGGAMFGALEQNERFVDRVSDTLRRADRNPATGVASVASARVEAALRTAGLTTPPGPVRVEPGVLLGIPPSSGFVDDPICAANGNFVEVHTDLAFPGRAAVLDVVRVHNSLDSARIGAFGPGWTSSLDLRIAHVPGGVLRVHLADGAVVPFVPEAGDDAGPLRAVGNRPLRVERATDGEGWVLHEGRTKTWCFDGDGALVGGCAGAARLEVEREGERVVVLRELVSGRSVRFVWEAGRVVEAQANDGRRATYRYDDGVLVGVERPTGGTTFEVEGTRIVAMTDADGVVLARNVYDEAGRVLQQTNELGRTTQYLYTDNGTTVISDTTGGPRNAFSHDDRGNVTAVVDGTGRAMRLVYDERGRTTRITDRDGAVRRFAYDAGDNLVERVDPDGRTARWAWDEWGRLMAETHRSGEVTTYAYEGAGRQPTRIVEPGGGVITITVDEHDQPVRIVDADGVSTTFEWDADGQVVARIDGLGNRTTFSYDPAGLLTTVVDGSGVSTQLESDARGRVIGARVGGATSHYAYTAAGRPSGGADQEGVSWSATYGTHGRAVTFTDGLGSTVGFEWDVLGHLVGIVAPDGERYEQDFDAAGRLVAARDPEGRTTRTEVDAEGRVLGVVDAGGRTWRRELDVLGRTAARVGPDGGRTTYRYHPNGIVAAVQRPDGTAVSTELDAAGRVVTVVDEAGGRFSLAYTPAGRLQERRSPGGRVERWEYDDAGRCVASIAPGREVRVELDGHGRTVRLRDGVRDVRWRYDAAGDVVAVDGDHAITIERDRAGRITALTDADGVRSTYEWDERGLLARATEGPGIATTFQRDIRGRLASTTSAAGDTTTLAYDRTGHLQALTDPTGSLTRVLDPAGHVLAERQVDGSGIERRIDGHGRTTALGAVGAEPTATFGYDAVGRLTEAVRVADGVRTAFDWDDAGRVVAIHGPTGDLAVDRDADGTVTSWRIPAGTVQVRRDLAGRIVGLHDPEIGEVDNPSVIAPRRDRAGRIVGSERGATYRYDEAGRLVESVDESGARWAFEYDPVTGLLVGEDSPLGRRRFHRGFLGRLERIDDEGTSTELHYDAAGRRIRADRSDGVTTRWSWDPIGHLVGVERTDPGGSVERLDLALDAWGRPFRVGGVEVEWDDPGTTRPSRIGPTRYLHLAGRARVASAAGEWTRPSPDPWGGGDAAGAAGPTLGHRDELAAWGLVWMGRVCTTRGPVSSSRPIRCRPCRAGPVRRASTPMGSSTRSTSSTPRGAGPSARRTSTPSATARRAADSGRPGRRSPTIRGAPWPRWPSSQSGRRCSSRRPPPSGRASSSAPP